MLTKGDKCIIIIRYYNFAMIKTEADQPLYGESTASGICLTPF